MSALGTSITDALLVTGKGIRFPVPRTLTHIATLVFRKSRHTLILKLSGKNAGSVNQDLTDKFQEPPPKLRQSLTWDRGNGPGYAAGAYRQHRSSGLLLQPSKPLATWHERENQWSDPTVPPQKTCHGQFTQQELDQVAAQLNNRPRKTLKFKTPTEILETGVVLTS